MAIRTSSGPFSPLRASLTLALGAALAWSAQGSARASSPQAWASYGREVQRACLAASRLRQAKPAGDRLDLGGQGEGAGLISALLLRGTYPQPHLAGRSGQELCLYDASRKRVRIGDADRLDLQARPTR
ncbi:MAG: hypothetical protein ACO3FA_04405 [Vulcanococcus sp.]|jgi:hypothetical protein